MACSRLFAQAVGVWSCWLPGENKSLPQLWQCPLVDFTSSPGGRARRNGCPWPALTAQDDGTTRPIDPARTASTSACHLLSRRLERHNRRLAGHLRRSSGSTPLWPGRPHDSGAAGGLFARASATNPEASQPSATVVQRRSGAPLTFSVIALVLLLRALVSVGGVLALSTPVALLAQMRPADADGWPPCYQLPRRRHRAICFIETPRASLRSIILSDWTVKPTAAQAGTGVGPGGAELDRRNGDSSIRPLPTRRRSKRSSTDQLQQLARPRFRQQSAAVAGWRVRWLRRGLRLAWIGFPNSKVRVKEHLVVLATVHGGSLPSSSLSLLEPPGNLTSADEATLETMLASFTFV